MSGIYTDEAGVEFHVVFKARTPFSKIAEVGDAAFLTKMPLEVRSLCDRVGRRFLNSQSRMLLWSTIPHYFFIHANISQPAHEDPYSS